MEWLRQLRRIREFSEEFERNARRSGYGAAVIRVTDLSSSRGILGWLDGATRTILEAIEFRFGRE